MGRFEHRVTGDVIDISSGRDSDSAHLRGERVAQVIAIEIERGDHVIICRAQQELLKRVVGDGVVDHNARARFAHGNLAPGTAINLFRAEILLCDFISPVAERPLREFHDVALMNQRHALAAVGDGIRDRAVHQADGAGSTHRFDSDSNANVVLFRCANFFPKIRRFLFCSEANLLELLRKLLF